MSFWEAAFSEKRLMWGSEPTLSALQAAELFARSSAKEVLIPGFGYGRNASVFLERGMNVTGIEISPTAIALAKSELKLTVPVHEGSVNDMPFDDKVYDGIYAFGVLYLVGDRQARIKFIRDCFSQLAAGGHMVFVLIAKSAPMFGVGEKLAEDWYQRWPGMTMFFYDESSIRDEFDGCGVIEISAIDETYAHGPSLPFLSVCVKK